MKLQEMSRKLSEAAVDVADNVVRQSRQLSSQARLQLMLQRLEIDRRKALRELGLETYQLYEAADLAAAATSPRVGELCSQLDLIQWQTSEAQRQLEEVKQARASGAPEPVAQDEQPEHGPAGAVAGSPIADAKQPQPHGTEPEVPHSEESTPQEPVPDVAERPASDAEAGIVDKPAL